MLFACINPKSPSVDNKKLFGVKWIQFIDSGGQLQYHDILPLFIQDSMVTIFVLKLSEELSHHPTIEYYGADGKRVGKPYRSSLSHKQILQHCLGVIHSQDAHPLIIIIGTHRDAKDSCAETIQEKNQQLQALLGSAHFEVLCCGERTKELIFAVNGLSPEDVDRHVAQVLKKQILSMSPQQLIKMPIAWFGLEVVLQRSSHDGVLSLVECQVSAKKFHIEGDAFSDAHVNVLMLCGLWLWLATFYISDLIPSFRRLYEEAMTKGYVETSVTKCLILGAAGVGKTHLKHLLLKKDHPKQRVSTGLADNPIRAISFTLAGVGGQEEDDWFVVEDDQALMSVIGGTIKGGVSMAPSLADVVSTLPKMAIDPSNVPSDGAVGPTPAGVNITKDTTQPEQSRTADIEDELVHHINQSSGKSIRPCYLLVFTLNLPL